MPILNLPRISIRSQHVQGIHMSWKPWLRSDLNTQFFYSWLCMMSLRVEIYNIAETIQQLRAWAQKRHLLYVSVGSPPLEINFHDSSKRLQGGSSTLRYSKRLNTQDSPSLSSTEEASQSQRLHNPPKKSSYIRLQHLNPPPAVLTLCLWEVANQKEAKTGCFKQRMTWQVPPKLI